MMSGPLQGPGKPSPPPPLSACTWLASYSVQLPETPLRILCHGNDGPFASAALMLFLRTWIYDLANYSILFVTNIDMTIGHFDENAAFLANLISKPVPYLIHITKVKTTS